MPAKWWLVRVLWITTAVWVSACTGHTAPEPATRPAVQFSILEDYDKGDSLAEVARDFDLFHELGITTWRGSFGWDDYEPASGAYDFEWLHRFAELAETRGITLRPYIAYTPAWASGGGTDGDVWNDPPRDPDAWYRFARTLAAEMRRHRNIVSFEIYNEENVRQWWDGPPDAYREVLDGGAAAIRAGNPDAEVLMGGLVFPDAEWLEQVCREGRTPVDVIPFHAYPETWTPPEVTLERYLGPAFASGFVARADAACGQKPIWINETGFATVPGRTEAEQAAWWLRAVATFLSEPRVVHIGVYEIKDLRPDRPAIGDTPNYHLGLTDVNRRRKMAFGTVARLAAWFGGQRLRHTVPPLGSEAGADVSARVHRHLFAREDGVRLLFAWTQDGAATVDLQLPAHPSEAIEYGLDGSPAGRRRVEGTVLRSLALVPGQVRVLELRP